MAYSNDQIIQEYNKYFPGREVNEQDIANVQEKGLGVVQASYNQITGQQSTNSPTQTANQQGQTAAAPGSIEDVRGKRDQLLGTKNDFLSLVQESLTKAQDVMAPYDQAKADVRQRITELPKKGFSKGLAPDAALRKRANNIAYWKNELQYIKDQEDEAQAQIDADKEFMLKGIEDQIQAYGYSLEELMADRQYQLQLAQLARSGGGGGGGGGSDMAAKLTEAFYKDINYMQKDLAAGTKNWGQAFNTLVSKYGIPEEGYGQIDMLLDKQKWSQPGAYEAQQAGRTSDALKGEVDATGRLESLFGE